MLNTLFIIVGVVPIFGFMYNLNRWYDSIQEDLKTLFDLMQHTGRVFETQTVYNKRNLAALNDMLRGISDLKHIVNGQADQIDGLEREWYDHSE